MATRDIVVAGASAGGVEALRALAGGLPADLPAAVFVVLHMPPEGRTLLPRILNRAGPLLAAEASDGEPIQPGRIYVAPPNYHLLLDPDRVRVLAGPRENGLRPAADPLFRSAARVYRRRVVGVVLSGTRDDGAAGLKLIQRWGGVAVVQDPEDALFSGMPSSALLQTLVDYCLPVRDIPSLLDRLARTPLDPSPAGDTTVTDATADPGRGTEHASIPAAAPRVPKRDGQASGLTCPECHGSLWEEREDDQVWFECRVDHRYSFPAMLAEQARSVEASIWAAVNVLEERAALLHKQSDRARERGNATVADRFAEDAAECQVHADAIRRSLLSLIQTFSEGARGEGPAAGAP